MECGEIGCVGELNESEDGTLTCPKCGVEDTPCPGGNCSL